MGARQTSCIQIILYILGCHRQLQHFLYLQWPHITEAQAEQEDLIRPNVLFPLVGTKGRFAWDERTRRERSSVCFPLSTTSLGQEEEEECQHVSTHEKM